MCFLPVQEALTYAVLPAEVIGVWNKEHWLIVSGLLSVGYISGSVLTGLYEIKQRLLLPLSVLFFTAPALQIVLYYFTDSFLVLAISAVFVGACLELSGVCWGTYLQSTVAEKDMGKVSSLDYSASFGLIPVGYAVAGVAMTEFGVQQTLGIGAVIVAFGVVVAVAIFFSLRRAA